MIDFLFGKLLFKYPFTYFKKLTDFFIIKNNKYTVRIVKTINNMDIKHM